MGAQISFIPPVGAEVQRLQRMIELDAAACEESLQAAAVLEGLGAFGGAARARIRASRYADAAFTFAERLTRLREGRS